MALTIFPIIVFNAATGSDSAASGAGPASAITGTAKSSTASTTVEFNEAVDLSGVAQDGSHVLWVNGIGFVRISTADDAANTLVVETALTIGAGTSLAIGGKRATLDNAESRRLFAATATPTASGASGQWTISLEDDQSLTSAVAMAFTAGTGELLLQSSSTTRRTITQTANAVFFSHTATHLLRLKTLQFRDTNAIKNAVYYSITGGSPVVVMDNCIVGAADGTNCPSSACNRGAGGAPTFVLWNSSVLRTTGIGVSVASFATYIHGSEIVNCGGIGVQHAAGTLLVSNSIIAGNAGVGIDGTTGPVTVLNSIIDGNTGSGIVNTNNNAGPTKVVLVNNQITNNGSSGTAYGLNLSGTAPHPAIVENNNFYGNRTAPANGITLSSTNLTLDPQYVDRTITVRNYAIGTNCKAKGFPDSTATIGAGQSGTTSYVDIGAAQRQEAGGVIIIDD